MITTPKFLNAKPNTAPVARNDDNVEVDEDQAVLIEVLANDEDADKNKTIVCFGSFQDYLGRNKNTGGK